MRRARNLFYNFVDVPIIRCFAASDVEAFDISPPRASFLYDCGKATLNCGYGGDLWVGHALECVPDDVWTEHSDRFSFISTTDSDGRRLGRMAHEGRHVIVLSERVIPRGPVAEDHPVVRYLYYVVLHEVAHAVRDHQPPNEITAEANQAQEDEADALALEWFNAYLATKAVNGLTLYALEELAAAQPRTQAQMLAAQQGG